MIGEGLEIKSTLLTDHICKDDLGRKEINRRVAVALMDFVENVSAGMSPIKGADGKISRSARAEETAILPEIARVLLEVSQRMPEADVLERRKDGKKVSGTDD